MCWAFLSAWQSGKCGESINVKQKTGVRGDETGKIVPDATACCSSGIEFELKNGYKYPDDYPPEGAIIQVLGEFDSCKDGEYRYYTLRNADLVG